MNTLYFGDNLGILKRHISDESIDLIYLDPPFNSNRDYNVLFREQSGSESPAQIKAFGATWNWQARRRRGTILRTSVPYQKSSN
jgi:adenine specific DNA methylase Mod